MSDNSNCKHCGGCDNCDRCSHCSHCRKCGKYVAHFVVQPYVGPFTQIPYYPWDQQPWSPTTTITWGGSTIR